MKREFIYHFSFGKINKILLIWTNFEKNYIIAFSQTQYQADYIVDPFFHVQQRQPKDGVHRHVLCAQLSLIFGLVKVTHRLFFHLSYMVFLCRFLPHSSKLWEFVGRNIQNTSRINVLGKQNIVTVQILTTPQKNERK